MICRCGAAFTPTENPNVYECERGHIVAAGLVRSQNAATMPAADATRPVQAGVSAKRGRVQIAPKSEREADGITFHSKRERDRYLDLKLREKAGEIANLELQKRYEMKLNGVRICEYVADFVYIEIHGGFGRAVTEDAKGHRDYAYKLKRKMMKAFHGIDIRET